MIKAKAWTPFPVIEPAIDRWEWPTPPFSWRHVPPPAGDVPQPCRIDTAWGTTIDGEMVDFDPSAACLKFRRDADGPQAVVPFARIRRLVLTTPLSPQPRPRGVPAERVPSAAQERDYRLQVRNGNHLTGRTAGYVVSDTGLFLFTPVDEERGLQRVFVPRGAYTACEFGPSTEELAAERWISTPQALLEAIERQQRTPPLRMGEALLNLGLVTSAQLERALKHQRGDVPLGETLVAQGVISRGDLNTALAHKMGYPLVDLTRFPIDLAVARRLPLRLAVTSRALPLMVHADRLIVAVDKPSRVDKLHALHVFTGMKLVPVLASKSQVMLALGGLAQQDAWSHNVHASLLFAPSTA